MQELKLQTVMQLHAALQWIRTHPALIWWLTLASVAMFVASLISVPAVVARIPRDYFAHRKRPRSAWARKHFAVRAPLMVLKNILGIIILLAGAVMLIVPGQGILTLFVGIMLLDFPGKFRLERWFVSRHVVLRSLNWLRRRSNKEPLIVNP